ncbi:MAG: serine hydrolase [Lentisphaerales bacterium]|nr:serine hydrolase [Lentisphaerales bacterium]
MHRTMLKASICLLLLSAVIYVCGEYALVARELEKFQLLEESKEELAKNHPSLSTALKEPIVEEVIEPEEEKVFVSVENVNFQKINGLTPPSDRSVGAGILLDVKTQKILWGKNVTEEIPIASLTKVLTVITVLDEVRRREDVTMKTKIKISSSARSTRSSSFLRKHPHSEVPIDELLQSAMLKSANDSCQLLAEFFGEGDSKRFVAMMNAKARSLKMKHSMFFNPHGLPGAYYKPERPDNTSTIADLTLLVFEVMENYSGIFNWTSKQSMYLPKGHPRAVYVPNTNPLVPIRGVNGLKTGFTLNAGWCLITTCNRDGHFYISIVTGCKSKAIRNSFSRSLLLWGFKAIDKL